MPATRTRSHSCFPVVKTTVFVAVRCTIIVAFTAADITVQIPRHPCLVTDFHSLVVLYIARITTTAVAIAIIAVGTGKS